MLFHQSIKSIQRNGTLSEWEKCARCKGGLGSEWVTVMSGNAINRRKLREGTDSPAKVKTEQGAQNAHVWRTTRPEDQRPDTFPKVQLNLFLKRNM